MSYIFDGSLATACCAHIRISSPFLQRSLSFSSAHYTYVGLTLTRPFNSPDFFRLFEIFHSEMDRWKRIVGVLNDILFVIGIR